MTLWVGNLCQLKLSASWLINRQTSGSADFLPIILHRHAAHPRITCSGIYRNTYSALYGAASFSSWRRVLIGLTRHRQNCHGKDAKPKIRISWVTYKLTRVCDRDRTSKGVTDLHDGYLPQGAHRGSEHSIAYWGAFKFQDVFCLIGEVCTLNLIITFTA